MDPKSSADPDDHIIDYLLANPQQIDLYYWNQNPNPKIIDYILEEPRDRLYRSIASKNPHNKMVEYLIETPAEISIPNFLENPNPKAIEYIFERGWHLIPENMHYLARNPNPIIKDYMENIAPLVLSPRRM